MSESQPPQRAGGRRSADVQSRRVDVLVALAIALPVVVALSVALIGRESNPLTGPQAPTTAALTSATVVCPSALAAKGAPVRAARAPGVSGGEVSLRTAEVAPATDTGTGQVETEAGDPITVAAEGSIVVPSSGGVSVLDGRKNAAPGLVAGRNETLAVPECRAPSYDEWLVGVGASARYATVLELVNPDEGDAVVDLELLSTTGPVDEPALRGIQVPGHSVKRIDLARAAPRSGATAAHLTVTRGRVTATARNTQDPLGRGRVTADFLPADAEPSASSLILGLPDKPSRPTLFLANPGDDEVRVTTRLVTPEAVFTPAGAKEIAVPPHSLKAVRIDSILSDAAAKGALGVQLESTGPVVSSLRLMASNDIVLLAPTPELNDPVTAVLPEGAKTLVLGGARRTGVIHVTSYGADGKQLADERVEIGEDRAASLALPAGAVSVAIDARNTPISGVVLLPTKGKLPGLATLRVRPAELRARIPVVAPK